MKQPGVLVKPLRHLFGDREACEERHLWGANASAALGDLLAGTSLGGRLSELSGRSVLLATRSQFAAALAMVELDGVARRMVLCPPDIAPEHLPTLAEKAGIDAVVSDRDLHIGGISLNVPAGCAVIPQGSLPDAIHSTEWVLLTSGTTGTPKMLAHNLEGLTGPLRRRQHQGEDVVWGTFYDIRRYGGLQIFLRGLLGQGSLILSETGEPLKDHLLRLAAHSVTHLTGTPSHWRRALMSPHARDIAPRYVRLSGEIADQAILNTLRSFYPDAALGHAFASTEAGVGFEVNDGLEGFPASLVGDSGDVQVRVEENSLLIRSTRTASSYIGESGEVLADSNGFVDTGDMVERRGERYYFLGRRSGMINVGGQKVYPEEVEAQLNRHPAVRMSRVLARKNPITGSLVVAEVVLKGEADAAADRIAELQREMLALCRAALPRHKVPASFRFVPALAVSETGKLVRSHA